jgi:hypothetical protein
MTTNMTLILWTVEKNSRKSYLKMASMISFDMLFLSVTICLSQFSQAVTMERAFVFKDIFLFYLLFLFDIVFQNAPYPNS